MLKRNETAPFDLLTWLEGRTVATGVFEDRKGRIRRRFTVEMTGEARADTLHLAESFLFADGERQQRTWILTRDPAGGFTGRCEDAVSEARGEFGEGVAYLRSELRLKVGTRLIAMRFDDAFYEAGGDMVLNRSAVSKWGIRLGQVLIVFRKAQ
jgi:hypothetical protein